MDTHAILKDRVELGDQLAFLTGVETPTRRRRCNVSCALRRRRQGWCGFARARRAKSLWRVLRMGQKWQAPPICDNSALPNLTNFTGSQTPQTLEHRACAQRIVER